MSDVRLTALNPVDSQVYPVACNDKGELILEPFQGDVNIPGNLVVTGSGTFDGTVVSNADPAFDCSGVIKSGSNNPTTGTGSWIQQYGGIYTTRGPGSADPVFAGYQQGSFMPTAVINADGTANFAGNVTAPNITLQVAGTIDPGFGLPRPEISLLDELMSLRSQISTLTAFMQRVEQDSLEN